jgi:hypothetical protein
MGVRLVAIFQQERRGRCYNAAVAMPAQNEARFKPFLGADKVILELAII